MAYQEIQVERQEGVGVITLNRPDKLNALTNQGWIELRGALGELNGDPQVRVVLLTGAGRGFCAGIDVASAGTVGSQAIISILDMIPAPAFIRCGKPSIAAVNGIASGGGLGLALSCDLRIASDQARFNSSFIQRGLVPDAGTSYLLPRVVGLPKALELMFTGEMIDAAGALGLGLVNRVVPHEELWPAALTLARRLAQGPPLALALTKRLVYQSMASEIEQHCDLEMNFQYICFGTDDFKEGVQSFRERRQPAFKGR